MFCILQDQIVSQNLILCEKGTHIHLINACSSLHSVAVLKIVTKGILGRKGSTSLLRVQRPSERKVRAGSWRQELRQGLWRDSQLARFPWLASRSSLHNPDYLFRRGTAHFSH